MKRRILVFILVCTAALLSYRIQSFEFILIAIILISLVVLLLAGIGNYFKKINSEYLKIPALIICICLTGILVSLFRPYEIPVLVRGTVSEKLEYAHSSDQNDRKQLRSYVKVLSEMAPRDKQRRKQVNELYQQDKIVKSIDRFYAAFIYHHGSTSEDFKIASELSSAAAKDPGLKNHYQVQWLARASYDRYMVSIGKEEKYDTQNKLSFDIE